MAVARLVPRQAAAGKAFRCKPRFGIWNAGGAIAGIDAQATADEPQCIPDNDRAILAAVPDGFVHEIGRRLVQPDQIADYCRRSESPVRIEPDLSSNKERAVARELRMNGEPALWPP